MGAPPLKDKPCIGCPRRCPLCRARARERLTASLGRAAAVTVAPLAALTALAALALGVVVAAAEAAGAAAAHTWGPTHLLLILCVGRYCGGHGHIAPAAAVRLVSCPPLDRRPFRRRAAAGREHARGGPLAHYASATAERREACPLVN